MFVVRMLVGSALMGLTVCVAGPVTSQTLSGGDVQLHEGELVSSSVPSSSNGSGTVRVERPMVGGLAPGHSTGSSGLQLEGGVVAVPEPPSGLQSLVSILWLVALGWRCREIRK